MRRDEIERPDRLLVDDHRRIRGLSPHPQTHRRLRPRHRRRTRGEKEQKEKRGTNRKTRKIRKKTLLIFLIFL
jgi:hypothetical protein